jgi:hypothetical protein
MKFLNKPLTGSVERSVTLPLLMEVLQELSIFSYLMFILRNYDCFFGLFKIDSIDYNKPSLSNNLKDLLKIHDIITPKLSIDLWNTIKELIKIHKWELKYHEGFNHMLGVWDEYLTYVHNFSHQVGEFKETYVHAKAECNDESKMFDINISLLLDKKIEINYVIELIEKLITDKNVVSCMIQV